MVDAQQDVKKDRPIFNPIPIHRVATHMHMQQRLFR